jgi:SPP1 gp7 family putative phage head morphogenesis protein
MADYGSLSFAEQIAFFQAKLNLPTARWDDLMRAAHDRAFVVAGAMQADLLADLREAVRKGIEEGTTLEEFRRDFRALVEKNGWTGWTGEGTAGGEAWRTKVIYETNLRSSYAAGRYQQMQAIKHRRPYWRYRHNDSVINPRPEHLALDGKIVHADDPFWTTHFPPNGWGCRCYVETLAPRDLERLGIDPDSLQAPEVIIDPKTGDPVGIDKGWGYAPGASVQQELADLLGAKRDSLLRRDPDIWTALAQSLQQISWLWQLMGLGD